MFYLFKAEGNLSKTNDSAEKGHNKPKSDRLRLDAVDSRPEIQGRARPPGPRREQHSAVIAKRCGFCRRAVF
jgi:hypothetical protein